ncbi:MAG: MGDG synthase family glycosyltransferase [Heyndrickxia sp.]
MKKVLVFPFMRMPSGHHQVAEAVIHLLNENMNEMVINKMDFLTYTSNKLERIITNSYLKWIRYAPGTYEWAYKHLFYSGASVKVRWYHHLFLTKMKQLIEEEQPDLIICTHGFPSLLLSHLKQKGKLQTPVVNVYTDFFINSVWGKKGIDAHFVPNQQIKTRLMDEYQIPETKVFVTGIPVHGDFKKAEHHMEWQHTRKKVLVSGGSSGLGDILAMLQEAKESNRFEYIVLCGKNRRLFQEISSWNLSHIHPVSYVTSRLDMNALYDQVDAIITKPGGVTVSEALQKRLPIFIHSALPGQEEINLKFLKQRGLVFELHHEKSFEKQLFAILDNRKILSQLFERMDSYFQGMELNDAKSILKVMQSLLERKTYLEDRSTFMEKLYPAILGRKATATSYTSGNSH